MHSSGSDRDSGCRKGRIAAVRKNLSEKGLASISKEPSTSRKNDLSSSDSLLNSSNRECTADDELGAHAGRLQKLTQTDVPQPDLDRSTTEGETYAASGMRKSLHGTVYQLKLLMLLLHRVWKIGYFFKLATEMDAAEKFDDVVLRYRDNNGDEVCRFVQAKHKQDGTKMIRASDLLDVEGGDFSLLKYFISWREIKKNPIFGSGTLKDFILYTNIGLHKDSLKKENINISEMMDPDDILVGTNGSRQSPRYKLLVENSSDLWKTLKSPPDVHRLAKELAKRACGSLDIQLKTDIIKSYHVALADEVVDVPKKKFFANFIDDNCLSREAAEFRQIFFLHTKRLLSKRNLSDNDIWKFLRKRSLKLSSTFGKKKNKSDQTQFTKLPKSQINDAEISSFFEEFILAVNQPNEVELGDMIEHEIGMHGQLDKREAGIVTDAFQAEILNWLKTREGRFWQKEDADNFFDKMKDHLSSIKTTMLWSEYSEELKNLGIWFNSENEELENFISCPDHTINQVLEIICPKQTLLTSLQVSQALERPREREVNKGFIFVRLEKLSSPEMIELLLFAFKSPHNSNLLVVDCESTSAEQHLQTLWNPLHDITANDVHKKMIVITQSGKDLGTKCTFSRKTCRVKYTDHSFDQLTNDSREKLLGKQVTMFQGKNNATSFGELLGVRDHDNLGEDELKDLSKIMDSETLVELILRKEIHIDCDLDGLDDIQDYYISRTISRHIFIKKDIFENEQIPDLLAISGIGEILPPELVRMGKTSLTRQDQVFRIDGTSEAQAATNLITLDSNREEEQFIALCEKNEDRNVHWLKREREKYIWKRSQGNITHLVEHRDYGGTDDNNARTDVTYLSESQLTAYDEPVIISDTAGTGKSTMLTYVASKIKKDKPDTLVLKINLNDHTIDLREVKEKSTYDLGSINGAVQFLVDKVLSRETNLTRKVCRRIIERKHKVALIFDGFDEISPTYKDSVIDLLKTFADHGIKKLLVATRVHTSATLETKLNRFSYEIQPFSTDDQKRFLTEFWKVKFQALPYDLPNIDEDRIRKYATAILIKLDDSIKDQENKFTGNPLQAKLVAEIFGDHSQGAEKHFDSCKEFTCSEIDEPQFPEKINVIYLYENFVTKKFDVFFEKRGGNLADVAVIEDRRLRYKSFIEHHQRLALVALFDKDRVTELRLSQQDSSNKSLETADFDIPVERDGIITQFIDGQPRFGHRTYAEYFAAKYFSDKLKAGQQSEPLVEIFVADVLLGENFDTMRAFIDWLLPDEHVDVLQGEFWALCSKTHRSQRQETIFHVAAAEGNGRIMRLFLNYFHANTKDRRDLLNARDILGRMAMHQAVAYGQLDKIKLLAEVTDVEIDSQCKLGFTPLHLTAIKTDRNVINYLLRKGADINRPAGNSMTLLHMIMGNVELDTVKYLCANGADINCQTNDHVTPLHLAAQEGKLDAVVYLHGNGADINCRRNDGLTPLDLAAGRGQLDVVVYLHENGADINCQTNDHVTPLHLAAQEGKLDVVVYLHENGADINCRTNDHLTPLHLAAGKGQLDIVKYLHGSEADINTRRNDGMTPLHLAAGTGELDVVMYLHENGADINCQANDHVTPLHLAAQEGKLDVVKYLHGSKADINCQINDGRTPLHLAAANGKLDVVMHLHGSKADINCQTNDHGTPLHLAAQEGKLDVVKYLHGSKADINCRRNDGMTPLHVAAFRGQLDVVVYLHGKGADINCQANDHVTPLHLAAQEGKLDVVKYLHGSKADINCRRNDGMTPLHLAAGKVKLDVVKYLHGSKADINTRRNDGMTPLHIAAAAGELDVVKYLHKSKADINCQSDDHATPLHLAAQEGELDVVKYLHGSKADINCQINDGRTPLHLAAANGKLDVVMYLHGSKADINCRRNDGMTPLHLAAKEGKLDVVVYLQENGADINCQSNDHVTPLHLAAGRGQLDVVVYLHGSKADINCQMNDGRTPLHLAAAEGKLDVVKYLHKSKADINCQTNNHVTPLHLAALKGNLDVVKSLCEKGAWLDSREMFGRTPLNLAVVAKKLDVVTYLTFMIMIMLYRALESKKA